MSEAKQVAFEGWAIVELLGHQREIGFVTTEAYGQAVMFRVDTPDLPAREFVLTHPEYASPEGDEDTRSWVPAGSKVKRPASPARTRLVAPSALYAINPCTEEAARTAIEKLSARPLILLEAPPTMAALPSPDMFEFENEDEEEDQDDDY